MSFGRRATKFDLVWYWVVNLGDNNATMARAAFAAFSVISRRARSNEVAKPFTRPKKASGAVRVGDSAKRLHTVA